jgi:hypothetical protein
MKIIYGVQLFVILSSCFSVFSFGCFPGVWFILADVSEHSIFSIFMADFHFLECHPAVSSLREMEQYSV